MVIIIYKVDTKVRIVLNSNMVPLPKKRFSVSGSLQPPMWNDCVNDRGVAALEREATPGPA